MIEARGRNLVLSSDGTWQSGGSGYATNVWKLHQAVDRLGHLNHAQLAEQITFYGDGVGTDRRRILRILGGAFGIGLSRNVKEMYAFLVDNYRPGDQIYLFGFSRGAYTIRILAAMVLHCGLLRRDRFATRRELEKGVSRAYEELRRKFFRTSTQRGVQKILPKRTKEAPESQDRILVPSIRFVGVWDTVDAYAIPSDSLARFVNSFIYCFRSDDQTLHPNIERACHALAIDEERRTFHPVMWSQANGHDQQRISQVWFPGPHSNVGGGYPKVGIASISLNWMLDEAEKQGLRFSADLRQQYKQEENLHDELYDSRAGVGSYYLYKVRDIGEITRAQVQSRQPAHIHNCALRRILHQTNGYAPGNFPLAIKFAGHNLPANEEQLAMKVGAAVGHKDLLRKFRWHRMAKRFSNIAWVIITAALMTSVAYLVGVRLSFFSGVHSELSKRVFYLTLIVGVIHWLLLRWVNRGMLTASSRFWRSLKLQIEEPQPTEVPRSMRREGSFNPESQR